MRKVFSVCLVVLMGVVLMAAPVDKKKEDGKTSPVLLVIDTQNKYLPMMSEEDRKHGIGMINYAIYLFRQNGFPVIRVYHTDLKWGPKADSEDFQFPKTIKVLESDPKIIKNYPSAFTKTQLDKLLKDKGYNTVFCCGLSAVGCVLATYYGAMDRGYEVFMIESGIISHDAKLTKAVEQITSTIGYKALEILLKNIKP